MTLSEGEIESRVSNLRRKRDMIDREIADLLLYLELGRRLNATGRSPADDSLAARRSAETQPSPQDRGTECHTGEEEENLRRQKASSSMTPQKDELPDSVALQDKAVDHRVAVDKPRMSQSVSNAMRIPELGGQIPPAVAFTDDPTAARRYGRALMEAAYAVIAQAGRPLHASEILERLVSRGFTIPGRDPVAALNTRLWKRATADGPLKRLGDASYALVEGGGAEDDIGETDG